MKLTAEKLKEIATGCHQYVKERTDLAYLSVAIDHPFVNGKGFDKERLEISFCLGAGWFCSLSKKDKDFLENLGRRISEKYSDFVPTAAFCGYKSGGLVQTTADYDMKKLSRQMNNPSYIEEKGA